jgi:Xaa-Pro aminopeptidase
VPSELRGIGIRIEDDVLITAKGPQVLTAAVPKTIREIEALVCGADGRRA